MVDIPLLALQANAPVVNGAANYIQGAKAKSDLDAQKLQQAQASISLMGSVALGAMGGDVNAPTADPAKWQQGVALLKAHGIDMSSYGPDFAPTLARASLGTLGQLQQANSNRDFELKLADFSNSLHQQAFTNQMGVNAANFEQHNALVPNSMFGVSTPDAQRAQSGLPALPQISANGQPVAPQVAAPNAPPAITGALPASPQSGLAAPAMGAAPGGATAQQPSAGGIMSIPPVGMGPDGKPDAAAQAQFLKALPPALADLVQKAGNYQLSPSQMFTLRSGNDRAQFDAVMARYDPTYDANQYAARAAYLKNVTNGPIAANVNSASTAIGHLAQLAGNATDLQNSSFPAWNAVANTVKAQTGQPAPVAFNVTAKAVSDELGKFFKGTGAVDVGSIESWHNSLDANASPAQQSAAIDTAIGLLKSRMDVLEQQYETTMGHAPPAGYSQFLRPDGAAALQALGYDPMTLEKTGTNPTVPAAGQQPAPQTGGASSGGPEPTATNPKTGARVVLRNGAWVPLQ